MQKYDCAKQGRQNSCPAWGKGPNGGGDGAQDCIEDMYTNEKIHVKDDGTCKQGKVCGHYFAIRGKNDQIGAEYNHYTHVACGFAYNENTQQWYINQNFKRVTENGEASFQCGGGEQNQPASPLVGECVTGSRDQYNDCGAVDPYEAGCNAPCVDKDLLCPHLESLGNCKSDADFMRTNCQKSCNICTSDEVEPPVDPNCKDYELRCGYWAENGDCTNPEFQSYHEQTCAKSCGFCTPFADNNDSSAESATPPPTSPPTLPPTSPPTMPPTHPPTMPPTMPPTSPPTMPPMDEQPQDPECMNHSPHCEFWFSNGDCVDYKEHMEQTCPQICNFCTPFQNDNDSGAEVSTEVASDPNCADLDEGCAYWKEIGECENNPVFMTATCQATCDFCGICEDTNLLCPHWASLGWCEDESQNLLMAGTCRKSCGLCESDEEELPVDPNCKDNDLQCPYWASVGDCTNPEYQGFHEMNCAKSCGFCSPTDYHGTSRRRGLRGKAKSI
ncbi:MAG: hypothetical protein SGILL_002583 [Bacillariaceae sp.]